MRNCDVFALRGVAWCTAMAGRVVAPAAMVLVTVVAATPSRGFAQQLVLTASVDKTVFFEDEPIYLLVRLDNVGVDTAWVTLFGLASPALTMSVRRGHGTATSVSKPVVNYLVPPAWRGEPIPPGASFQNTIVLQDIFGDEGDIRSHLFAHRLSPDHYQLDVAFEAHWGVPHTTPLTVEAAPLVLRVRERTPAEENEVKELEAMRQMGWDTTRVAGIPRAAGYKTTLIRWVERRLGDQPDDPFLPFLLSNGLYGVGQILWRHIQLGEVQRFDADTSEVVTRLRLAVIERNSLSTAGAHLVQTLSARHADLLPVLADDLGAGPPGDMARAYVERTHHAQPVKKQPPR